MYKYMYELSLLVGSYGFFLIIIFKAFSSIRHNSTIFPLGDSDLCTN